MNPFGPNSLIIFSKLFSRHGSANLAIVSLKIIAVLLATYFLGYFWYQSIIIHQYDTHIKPEPLATCTLSKSGYDIEVARDFSRFHIFPPKRHKYIRPRVDQWGDTIGRQPGLWLSRHDTLMSTTADEVGRYRPFTRPDKPIQLDKLQRKADSLYHDPLMAGGINISDYNSLLHTEITMSNRPAYVLNAYRVYKKGQINHFHFDPAIPSDTITTTTQHDDGHTSTTITFQKPRNAVVTFAEGNINPDTITLSWDQLCAFTDTIGNYECGTAFMSTMDALSFFTLGDLSQITERFHFEGDKLNRLLFYYGSVLKIDHATIEPDTIIEGGFCYNNAAKLRLIRDRGLTVHVSFPQMENAQNARQFLLTTLLTALLTYLASLIFKLLKILHRFWFKSRKRAIYIFLGVVITGLVLAIALTQCGVT